MALKPSTRLVHSGQVHTLGSPSAPAIHTAAVLTSAGDPSELPYSYGRAGNATWEELEAALGTLEDARATIFASGQAATFALMASLGAGRPRFLLPGDGYFGARKLAAKLSSFGVEMVPLDMRDHASVERELQSEPSVLWAESPTNPMLRVLDLEQLAAVAARAGAPMVVDNTTPTPALQKPLDLGATATVTSLTKSSAGHSDVVLGSVCTRDEELHADLADWRNLAGGIAGPFEAWVALRGLRTLPLRIARQSRSAAALAKLLSGHARVRHVHYPGLDPATRELARKQMPSGFGPLLSFEVDGDAKAAERVVTGSRLVRPASSFGGVESSWERRARWSGETAPEALIRMSVGIEDEEDLMRDVASALDNA